MSEENRVADALTRLAVESAKTAEGMAHVTKTVDEVKVHVGKIERETTQGFIRIGEAQAVLTTRVDLKSEVFGERLDSLEKTSNHRRHDPPGTAHTSPGGLHVPAQSSSVDQGQLVKWILSGLAGLTAIGTAIGAAISQLGSSSNPPP